MRNNDTQERSPVERSKSQESSSVVRTVKGSPVGHSKSRKSNSVVHTVSCAKILRGNILPR